MTAPTHTEGTRGRPRAFDEDQVLDSLVDLFWERGFDAASLTEIVDASGLNKSSLYNTFGSKDKLFDRVLDRYLHFREEMLAGAMAEGGLDALVDFFEFMRLEVNSEAGCRGCLMVNASTEMGLRSESVMDAAVRFRSTLRDGVRGPLARAAAEGEIAPEMVDVYADMVMSFCMSASVAVRGGAGGEEINTMIDSMTTLIESWRT